jgi:hypothetical protein
METQITIPITIANLPFNVFWVIFYFGLNDAWDIFDVLNLNATCKSINYVFENLLGFRFAKISTKLYNADFEKVSVRPEIENYQICKFKYLISFGIYRAIVCDKDTTIVEDKAFASRAPFTAYEKIVPLRINNLVFPYVITQDFFSFLSERGLTATVYDRRRLEVHGIMKERGFGKNTGNVTALSVWKHSIPISEQFINDTNGIIFHENIFSSREDKTKLAYLARYFVFDDNKKKHIDVIRYRLLHCSMRVDDLCVPSHSRMYLNVIIERCFYEPDFLKVTITQKVGDFGSYKTKELVHAKTFGTISNSLICQIHGIMKKFLNGDIDFYDSPSEYLPNFNYICVCEVCNLRKCISTEGLEKINRKSKVHCIGLTNPDGIKKEMFTKTPFWLQLYLCGKK